ncbi:PLP-dependent aminotransferase family protein [Cohnella boryungensis]|uniref:PLP-dependent aminotransferase family protein n=1 Tax=Cohnella boryungensis TaxID=768479 RepID=A0ABV8SII9_9BACL
MNWKPDKASHSPVYVQIAEHFEGRMRNGEYPSGSRLPSERALASQLGVNRSTIVSAYDHLASLGLVHRVKGLGTLASARSVCEQDTKRVPNWEQYAKSGSLHPNDPITQRIHAVLGSDKSYINFAIGELSSDLFPIELMQHAHSLIEVSQYLGYEHMQGNEGLRESISRHLRSHRGFASSASSILVTSGAQQAIQLIVQGLLQPGDAVAIEDPSYSFSLPIFRSAGLRTCLLPVDHDGIDPEQLIPLYRRHRIKMVFINPTFHNPTGATMSMERRRRLLELSTHYGFAIVEDDPYSLTGFGREPAGTLKSLDRDGSVLYVSSLSKIVSSGLRIGWIAGPQSVIRRLTDAKQQLDFGHANLPQWIAARLLDSSRMDEHLSRLRAGLQSKLLRTAEALRSELGDQVLYRLPQGGVHLWCELNGRWDELGLFRRGIDNGVVVTPGSTLGSTSRHVRLTYSRVNDEWIGPGIERFAEAYRQSLN